MATKFPNVQNIYPMVIKLFQITVKYNNIFPFQGPPKYTQVGIFGRKRNHLATLV
jgi:hypothetical protein